MPSAPIMATNLPANSVIELALALIADHFGLFEIRHFAGIDHDEGFEIQHAFQLTQSDVEQVADAATAGP